MWVTLSVMLLAVAPALAVPSAPDGGAPHAVSPPPPPARPSQNHAAARVSPILSPPPPLPTNPSNDPTLGGRANAPVTNPEIEQSRKPAWSGIPLTPLSASSPAAPTLAAPTEVRAGEGDWHRVLLADLGMTEYIPRKWQGMSVTLVQRLPADRLVTEAHLKIPFITPRAGLEHITSMAILVNGVSVAELTVPEMALGGSAHDIAIDPRIMGVQNDFTFVFGLAATKDGDVDPACYPPGAWQVVDSHNLPNCPCVPSGTWSIIEKHASIETRTVRLNGPNDLSTFPDFLGGSIEGRARVPVSFGAAPSLSTLRAGFLLAAYFGLAGRRGDELTPAEQLPSEDPHYWHNNLRVARFGARDLGPQEMDFPVRYGALPTESGVLLGISSDLERLGLPHFDGPSVQVVDNPTGRAAGAKLLVISAPTEAELTLLVEHMVRERADEARVHYRSVAFPAAWGKSQNPMPSQSTVVDPRRDPDERLGPGRQVRFSDLPGGDKLMIRGRNDGIMKIQFNLAPGTFFWPQAGMPVTLTYDQVLASKARQSKIVVEVNGRFVTIIQRANAFHSNGPKEVKFTLPQVYLGARNEMVIYSEFEAETEDCPDEHPEEYTVVSGDSTFDLRGATEFATLPDLSRLAWEGYPFTTKRDLSETAIVVPSPLSPQAASTILSVGAHLARVSGSACLGVTFTRPDGLAAGLDRDLIVVGTYESQPLARRWANQAPALAHTGGIVVRELEIVERLLKGFAGRDVAGETEQAMFAYQGTHGNAGLLTSFESPLHAGRTVVVLTATRETALPNLTALANAPAMRDGRSDTVLAVPSAVHSYRFGGNYGVGKLGSIKQTLWFFSMNSFLLMPLLLIGALIIGFVLLTFVVAREKQRLAQ